MSSGAKNKLWFLLFILVIFLSPLVKCQEPDQTQEVKSQNKKQKKKKGKEDDPEDIGNRDVGKGVNFYSLEKEIALGKQLAQELERNVKLVDDPVITEYVNRVGQNLVRNSDARVPFTIKVIDTEEPNALSLPGGFFYVNTGLIMLADSESELAGAMAHEIAHVAARHGTRQATRGQLANIASIPLIFWGGWIGYGVQSAAGVVIPGIFVKFSRNFENEADNLGSQYLYRAGYDPNALTEVFEKLSRLEKKKPGTIAKIFMDHAPTEVRAKKVQQIIAAFPPRESYIQNTSEFMDVKARLLAMHRPVKTTDKKDETRPTLRKGAGTDKVEPEKDKKKVDKNEEDDRPTLKRRN